MHPRNPYRNPPNFLELSESYPELKSHLVQTPSGCSIDFHDSSAQRCLTQALLYRDFGVKLTIPNDRLCPPVPNRLNYILWIQDIMRSTCAKTGETRTVVGVDIGTGASAIYPLLGCKTNTPWTFVATDIDSRSLEYAQMNIHQNDLDGRIQLLKVDPDGSLLPPSIFDELSQLDFTMCNPPFYSDIEEVLHSAEAKEYGPNAVCTGADNEMITQGGEIAFVGRIVKESQTWKTQCRWYSSMLGKMSSLINIVQMLRDSKVDNYAITEFVQGKTRRWAIAWSFTDERLPDSVARISNSALQSIMPPRNTLRQAFDLARTADELCAALTRVLADIEGVTFNSPTGQDEHQRSTSSLLVNACGNTWSRAARRKKLTGAPALPLNNKIPTLCCIIQLESTKSGSIEEISMVFNWSKGVDRGLFESFMSHVSRKVEIALETPGDSMVL